MDDETYNNMVDDLAETETSFTIEKTKVFSHLDIAHSLTKLVDILGVMQTQSNALKHINKNDEEELPKSKSPPPEDESLQSKYLNEYMGKNVLIKLYGNEEIEGELVDVTNNQFVVTTEDDDIHIHDIDDVVFISLID